MAWVAWIVWVVWVDKMFGASQKNCGVQNFSMGGTDDFVNFYYDSMTFYL